MAFVAVAEVVCGGLGMKCSLFTIVSNMLEREMIFPQWRCLLLLFRWRILGSLRGTRRNNTVTGNV